MKKTGLITLFLICFLSCIEKRKPEIKKQKSGQINGVWIDLILGGPPLPNEFKAIDSLTKKYKINYKRVEMGCEFSDKDILLKKKHNISNSKYFKDLEIVLGKNWKQNFDSEKIKLDSLVMNYR